MLVNFTLTIGATFLLLLHQFTAVAEAARRVSGATPGTLPDVGQLGSQLVGDAGLAVLVLLVTTTLSVYKPWGRTRYGRRKQVFLAVIGVIVAAFVVLHLTVGGLGGHGM